MPDGSVIEDMGIRRYLFEDYVEMYRREENATGDAHVTKVLRDFTAMYARRQLFYRCFDALVQGSSLARSRTSGRRGLKIVFHTNLLKYDDIIRESAKSNRVVILGNGIRQAALMTRSHMDYYPLHRIYNDLYTGILTGNDDLLRSCRQRLKRLLERIGPDVLVLNEDALPDSRLMLMAARDLGIPAVEIQHGVYQASHLIPTGRHVDFVFVWGDYFRDMYTGRGIRKPDSIKVLGYPFRQAMYPRGGGGRETVYYLGGDYERYAEELLPYKLEAVRGLQAICDSAGFRFVYRPHPGDDVGRLRSLMPGIAFTTSSEKLADSIRAGDIFISLASTALIEAALGGKLSLQLKNYPFEVDDYQKMGVCPRAFATCDDIASYLRGVSDQGGAAKFYTPVDSRFIELPPDGPGKRFLQLIDEII
jgi:hypothetical protein